MSKTEAGPNGDNTAQTGWYADPDDASREKFWSQEKERWYGTRPLRSSEEERAHRRRGNVIAVVIGLAVVAVVVGGVVWIASSLGGGDSEPAASSSPDVATVDFPSSCSDWLNNISGDRRLTLAGQYLDNEMPGHSAGDTQALTLLITQGCRSYGDAETPESIAAKSLAAYEQSR